MKALSLKTKQFCHFFFKLSPLQPKDPKVSDLHIPWSLLHTKLNLHMNQRYFMPIFKNYISIPISWKLYIFFFNAVYVELWNSKPLNSLNRCIKIRIHTIYTCISITCSQENPSFFVLFSPCSTLDVEGSGPAELKSSCHNSTAQQYCYISTTGSWEEHFFF